MTLKQLGVISLIEAGRMMPQAAIQCAIIAQRRETLGDIQMLKHDIREVEPLVAIHGCMGRRPTRFLPAAKDDAKFLSAR